MQQDTEPNPYRMLLRVVRHGAMSVNVLTALTLVAGVGASVLLAQWWLLPLVLIAAALVYVLGQSFVELVQVIVDMLVPK